MPKPRLLLIDDDLALLNVLTLALSKHFGVVKANSGERALEILTTADVDAVVTDWCMQGLGGEELLVALAERLPNKPIVVITGYSDESKAVAAVPYCSAFLRKPIAPELLRTALDRGLEQAGKRRKGIIEFNPGSLSVLIDLPPQTNHHVVMLTSTEQRVFSVLWAHAGIVVPHHDLAKAALAREPRENEVAEIFHRYIHRLRKKLEIPCFSCIETVRGRGARLVVKKHGSND